MDSRALEQLYLISQRSEAQAVVQEQIRDLLADIRGLLSKAQEEMIVQTSFSSPIQKLTLTSPMNTTQYTERPVDFVIVTALEEERDAVLAKLPGYRRLPPSEHDIRIYYEASLPTAFPDGNTGIYRIIIMPLLGMGRLQAANATTDAIRRWQPRYILLVGIAGGVAARGVTLGDVLISDQIVDYELQKITPKGADIRWEIYRADPRLVGACRNFSIDNCNSLITTPRPKAGSPKRLIGSVASGDKVIAFSDVMAQYRESWPMLIGVEMEAAGVAGAAFQTVEPPGFFMIRAVSDLADQRKNSTNVRKWRLYACDIAAAYTIALLRTGPIPSVSTKLIGPSARSPNIKNNLPQQLTPLVGRESELREIADLLTSDSCRLLTLAGPGGIGKTRLGLEAAFQLLDRFPDGVYFVPLAPVISPEFIVATIVESVKLDVQGQKNLEEQLLDHLNDKQLLLVLDNLEHLLEGVDIITRILTSTSKVKIVTTSRERLNLRSEWVFDVQGLPFPQVYIDDMFENYSAIQLFLQNARRVRVDISFSLAEKQSVSRICQLVQGVPLAIELASAWVRMLSCNEIVREIENSLDFLTTSMRDVPERHRSLRAVFEHSWRLLSDDEKQVYRKISVFRGGFHRRAAESVADASLYVLSTLTDRSLLHQNMGRYEILEVLRQYAEFKLSEMPEDEESSHDRHCEYYTRFLETREKQLLTGDKQGEAIQEISLEIENIRAAWQWATLRSKDTEIERALISLYMFYDYRGWFHEGEDAFRRAVRSLERDTSSNSRRRALGKALRYQGSFCRTISRYEEARKLHEKSLTTLQSLDRSPDVTREIGLALRGLGAISYAMGDYQDAKRRFESSVEVFKDIGALIEIVTPLMRLGDIASVLGDYNEAKRLLQESLGIYERFGDQRGIALCLANMGDADCRLGNYNEAKEMFDRGLSIFKALSDERGIGIATVNLGRVYCSLGDYKKAEEFCREGVEIFHKIGYQWGIPFALNYLARTFYGAERYEEARRTCEDSLARCRASNNPWNMCFALDVLGKVNAAIGVKDEARSNFFEALQIALDINATPLALDAVVGISSLATHPEDKGRAVELVLFCMEHNGSDNDTRLWASSILAQLTLEVTPEVMLDSQKRSKTLHLEDVVKKLLSK
jgi:predicted ATPase/nucleoside phosphorylase